MNTHVNFHKDDVKQLNSFLKDELAAVETYGQCIEKVDSPSITADLSNLRNSHQQRVALLTAKVRELGGKPETDSGVWGSFAKMVEGGAKMFGEKAALKVLEEGEDRGRDNYSEEASKLSPAMQTFINRTIMPEQQLSHNKLNAVINRIQ